MSVQNPTFTVYVGPMFSAKTSKLLLDLERFKHQRKRVMVFKPKMDDRYSSCEIVSHGGWRYPAVTIEVGVDIYGALSEVEHAPDVVAVDEAFMVPGVADVLTYLYQLGINVVASTLDLSSKGKPFQEVEKLLAWATRVEKCAAVCAECGRDAHYTHKKQVSDEEIEVGSDELYEPRCFAHHVAVNKRHQING